MEAAGGVFVNGRLFGMLQPTRSFGDEDVHRSVVFRVMYTYTAV